MNKIEQVKKILKGDKERRLILVYDDEEGTVIPDLAQEIVALFTPQEQKPEVLGELRENLKEILPVTILTSVEAGRTADQIIEMVLAHGYARIDDTTRIFFNGGELNEDEYQEYMKQWAKAHGWVEIDENQELPPLRHQLYYGSGYAEAQQDMIAAGFRKVKGRPPKETE